MRILVLTDTHGHLELINTFVEKHKADAVVHCGDFGIESANRLSQTPQYVTFLLLIWEYCLLKLKGEN